MAKKAVDDKSKPKFDVGETIKLNLHHPLYAGQSAIITQDTGSGNFIVKLESGDRVVVPDWYLSPISISKEYLSTEEIAIDGGTQSRACLNDATLDDYAEAMDGGAEFPPVLVFYDGSHYWLADGFHRLAAAKKLEWGGIRAEIRQGTRREAVLYSVGANAAHGLRRTNADKRRAVMLLLGDEEWSQWSNREIAKQCCVSLGLVNAIRKDVKDVSEHNVQIDGERKVQRNGTTYTMDTRKIGQLSSDLKTSGSRSPKLDNGEINAENVPKPIGFHQPQEPEDPKLIDKRLPLSSVSALDTVVKDAEDNVVVEIAMGLGNLSPEQVACAITSAGNNKWNDEHLKAVIKAAKQVLNFKHHPEYFKGESA